MKYLLLLTLFSFNSYADNVYAIFCTDDRHETFVKEWYNDLKQAKAFLKNTTEENCYIELTDFDVVIDAIRQNNIDHDTRDSEK